MQTLRSLVKFVVLMFPYEDTPTRRRLEHSDGVSQLSAESGSRRDLEGSIWSVMAQYREGRTPNQ
jgi:hypothetical protein